MDKLLIFDFTLIFLISIGLYFINKWVKRELTQNMILIAAAIITIVFHYSAFIMDVLTGGNAFEHLRTTPNLILPIYPCNVVMWSALIFALLKNKKSKFGSFLADYLVWFGIISTLVGMFANVDFIKNPTFADYQNIKSIGAHATLLFNVLLLPIFGYTKIDVKRNILNIIFAIIGMGVIGCYCNIIFSSLVSEKAAYDINSMFLIHSPFDGIDFLIYPVIALIAIPIYFLVFVVCDTCAHKKGERFWDKLISKKHNEIDKKE